MIEQLTGFVLDESKWLPIAMLAAILAVAALAGGRRRRSLPGRLRITSAMDLFYGCMIGIMAVGHLLAVTVSASQGTLTRSPWFLYAIGVVLAVPAWWLALRGGRLPTDEENGGRRSVALNATLAVFLVALGPHNLPLAVPAALNIAYRFHTRRAVGWTVAAVAATAYLALFVGSLIFFLSGQSFEEFSGLE